MQLAHACLCCRSTDLRAWPAIVAPFLAERALGSPPTRQRLLQCRRCGFRFFDVRLDDAEIARLYDGYRDERYLRERRRHEWWYTRRANEHLGADEVRVRARRRELSRFLGAHCTLDGVSSVLDYGGDRGQLIPPELGAERFVFDLSGVAPADGVQPIRSERELSDRTFDLVLLSHVLEHVSEPAAFLERLRPLGRADALLYVEVPLERPRLGGVLRGRAGEAWLDLLLAAPRALRAFDFYSTAFRVGLGIVPPLGFTKVHEHLNFFEARSLRGLLERVGFEVVAIECASALIRCLARFT